MGVFWLNRQTTKCRIVFLSNLAEQSHDGSFTASHNQAMLPGPSLNQKLASALIHLRFGNYLLIFDIVKAFNQISLNDMDQCVITHLK